MSPRRSLRPLTTTLIGGVVFLLPLIVVLVVVGHALQVAVQAVQPVVQHVPQARIGGIAVATLAAVALLLALCYGAGLVARAAFGRQLSTRFEEQLATVYPRYHVIKAMSEGLHGALGRQVLRPVLVSFEDHQLPAYEIERLPDDRVVLFVPGAPDVWSGSVLLVPGTRVAALPADATALARALAGLGRGLAAQLAHTRPVA
jgi:uncharacterized membrane protein